MSRTAFKKFLMLGSVAAAFASVNAFALPVMQSAFLEKYPATVNTALASCATCHLPIKEGFVNSYGLALKNAKLDFAAIEGLPSAVAGKTNLEQITALLNPGSQAVDPEVFDFPNEMGTVRFNHGGHIMNANTKITGNCGACHGEGEKQFPKVFDPTVVLKAAAHTTCIGCHKAVAVPAAPTKCAGCHQE
ncbi:MAG: cytochrome c family protein [Oligoflexia bacterium]|nr:cytochrome c family protein [Oligoflexia bacterium]